MNACAAESNPGSDLSPRNTALLRTELLGTGGVPVRGGILYMLLLVIGTEMRRTLLFLLSTNSNGI